jgi:hypothetical protein
MGVSVPALPLAGMGIYRERVAPSIGPRRPRRHARVGAQGLFADPGISRHRKRKRFSPH